MKKEVRLTLLGNPVVWQNGQPLTGFRSNKARALLYYLAQTARPHTRFALAGLLWGGVADAQSRLSLNQTLSNLHRLLGTCLVTNSQEVVLERADDWWLDTDVFESESRHLGNQIILASLERAISLYRGDFLEGFYLHNAPEFEQWVLSERVRYRDLALRALERVASEHANRGDYEQAISYLRRLLAIEPWREEAHRQLMTALFQMGQRTAALVQYENCRQILYKELAVAPSRETVILYERIKQDDLRVANTTLSASQSAPQPLRSTHRSPLSLHHHHPPLQATPFVGRTKELTEVVNRLRQPDCRLLSLVGPGGIGKSRLALQAIHELLELEVVTQALSPTFAHGICFVELAAVSSISAIAPAIAGAADFAFYDNFPPRQQLLDFLREKSMLLVLDNFEHLLEGVDLIRDILAVAPGVKVLSTTQSTLNLHEEWSYRVDKLPYPEVDTDDAMNAEQFDAVQLFMQSAQRVMANFTLATESQHVIRICRLVEGMPLAIEMAAAWLKVIPCAKIADAIAHGLDPLAARWQNVPERQRTIRAVFQHSLQMLSSDAHTALMRLSVFRSGFRPEAAEQVAGTSLEMIAQLIEKSLLYTTTTGRCQMHGLLRQFCHELFQSNEIEWKRTHHKHSAYFLGFLKERERALKSQRLQITLDDIGEEIENIQAGWRWALDEGNLSIIEEALTILYQFYEYRGRYSEGEELFANAAVRIRHTSSLLNQPKSEAVLGKLLARQGTLGLSLGHQDVASQHLQQSLAIAQQQNQSSEIAFCLTQLGVLIGWQGEYAKAKERLLQGLALYRALGDLENSTDTLYELAEFAAFYGEYQEAKQLAQESVTISRQLGRQSSTAHALDKLGVACFYLGEYSESLRYYEESLAIFRELGNKVGVALALGGVGRVAWVQGGVHAPQAIQLLQESLAICRECGHRLHITTRLYLLGVALNSVGQYEKAFHACHEGLLLAQSLNIPLFVTLTLNGLGDAACGLGDFAASRTYLCEALLTNSTRQSVSRPTETLIYYATLLSKESLIGDAENSLEKKMLALKLLSFVLHQREGWHILLQRAQLLYSQLKAEFPSSAIEVTQSWALQHSLEEVILAVAMK